MVNAKVLRYKLVCSLEEIEIGFFRELEITLPNGKQIMIKELLYGMVERNGRYFDLSERHLNWETRTFTLTADQMAFMCLEPPGTAVFSWTAKAHLDLAAKQYLADLTRLHDQKKKSIRRHEQKLRKFRK